MWKMQNVVVHAYNPSTWEAEDSKFGTSLGYTERPCFKKENEQTKTAK
jgi:hypothetical protein